MSKKKIAVLGGGIGSLSALFGITSKPNWQEEYDITLYQLGWRLGGKGASGRNRELGYRIEEHGIHVWLGFYDNSFRAMRACYEELDRPKDAPLATIDDAFKKHSFITVKEFHNNEWKNWYVNFPENSKVPGTGNSREITDILGFIQTMIKWMVGTIKEIPLFHEENESDLSLPNKIKSLFKDLSIDEDSVKKQKLKKGAKTLASIESILDSLDLDKERELLKQVKDVDFKEITLSNVENFFKNIDEKVDNFLDNLNVEDEMHKLTQYISIYHLIKEFLEFIKDIEDTIENIEDDIRRLIVSIEFNAYCIKGILLDGVLWNGFEAIDNKDFREWLGDNGAPDRVKYFAPIRAFYDLALAYPKGYVGDDEPTREGNISAGVALHSMLLMVFAYKGAIMWKMQSGMGDVVFTPFYQVLKRRGVKFEFFHKVTNLIPNETNSAIEKIEINKQVNLIDPSKEYDPLIDVKGLPCWPSDPSYDQIVEGKELQERGINLESMWADWDGVENITLQKGVDFDEIICGIPITALKFISPKLADVSSSWKAMVDNVQSVRCLAMQTWMSTDLKGMGWEKPSTILDAYAQRFNTWADMSQTLKTEDWQGANEPLNVSYFCGTMADGKEPFPPPSEHNYPKEELAKVKADALAWTKKNIEGLWANVAKDGEVNWNLYFDSTEASGVDRFWWQYFRANIDPAERYSLSVANTNQYRLKAHSSDFSNLYLTGDWVDNGFLNVGCIEGTVIAGLKCAEAVSGESQNIIY